MQRSSVQSSSSVQGELLVRWLIAAVCVGCLLIFPIVACPQSRNFAAEIESRPAQSSKDTQILDEVSFTGLRHIAPGAVAAQMSLRAGEPFDDVQLERDVRALARLGWFESIQVVANNSYARSPEASIGPEHIALLFRVREFPFLSKVEYSGSHFLSGKQIEKLLEEKELAPTLGKPADPVALHRIALAIRSGLKELGHPDAKVEIRREESRSSTVSVRFEINDGPLLRVHRVNFEGNPQVPAKVLQAEMRRITPRKAFASLRGKDAYSEGAFEEDSQRILAYYQNHGYPEARVGFARVTRSEEKARRWLPWPGETTRAGLTLAIPVEAGLYYRFESMEAGESLRQAAEMRGEKAVGLSEMEKGQPYSAKNMEKLRRFWQARIDSNDSKLDSLPYRVVEARQTLDAQNHAVRVSFDLSDSPAYVVRRIEFQGLHKFSDRYVRRRILLREGQAVDERALEAGLARLARTRYFKPIRREDVHVQLDEAAHAADVSIRVEEIGEQRASLVGGHGQFGSTLGIAYTVFDLLNREELLSARLEGGPESVQIALGLAKEGIFGTRGSLALSVFNNVIRPRFASSAKGPFFTSRSAGIEIPWSYALTGSDTVSVNYTLTHTTSEYPLGTPPGLTELPPIDIQTSISSRSLGTGWVHDAGNQRVLLSDSVSGGWLGGGENMDRVSGEYAHIFRDPIFSNKNAWAFRTTFSGAGSYRGNMPFYARFFAGDELVRGLHTGELGPYALTTKMASSGATMYSPAPAGANLVSAGNTEYRVPLAGGTEAAGFFDLGSGWLLPNWLGPAKPVLLSSTNGVLHSSVGVELRWMVPGIQVPVRGYYALNVLRLNRSIPLSYKSVFHAHNSSSAFGWALGSLF